MLKLKTIVSPADLGFGKANGVSVSSDFKSKNEYSTNSFWIFLFFRKLAFLPALNSDTVMVIDSFPLIELWLPPMLSIKVRIFQKVSFNMSLMSKKWMINRPRNCPENCPHNCPENCPQIVLKIVRKNDWPYIRVNFVNSFLIRFELVFFRKVTLWKMSFEIFWPLRTTTPSESCEVELDSPVVV